MPALAELVTRAAERGDALGYALCVSVCVRRYRALGRDGDADATRDAAIATLAKAAPILAELLARDLAS
jgi:hypothetical protein